MRTQFVSALLLLCCLIVGGCADPKPETVKTPPAEEEQAPDVTQKQVDTVGVETPKPAEEKPKEAPAKPSTEKNVTIVGEVVDIVSFATAGSRGNTPAGKEIILASSGGGNPLGLLEQGTGQVYLVTMKQANTSANETLLPWVGMEVMAKGDVYRKGGQQLMVLNVIGKKPQ